jgi:hypothetical protein
MTTYGLRPDFDTMLDFANDSTWIDPLQMLAGVGRAFDRKYLDLKL